MNDDLPPDKYASSPRSINREAVDKLHQRAAEVGNFVGKYRAFTGNQYKNEIPRRKDGRVNYDALASALNGRFLWKASARKDLRFLPRYQTLEPGLGPVEGPMPLVHKARLIQGGVSRPPSISAATKRLIETINQEQREINESMLADQLFVKDFEPGHPLAKTSKERQEEMAAFRKHTRIIAEGRATIGNYLEAFEPEDFAEAPENPDGTRASYRLPFLDERYMSSKETGMHEFHQIIDWMHSTFEDDEPIPLTPRQVFALDTNLKAVEHTLGEMIKNWKENVEFVMSIDPSTVQPMSFTDLATNQIRTPTTSRVASLRALADIQEALIWIRATRKELEPASEFFQVHAIARRGPNENPPTAEDISRAYMTVKMSSPEERAFPMWASPYEQKRWSQPLRMVDAWRSKGVSDEKARMNTKRWLEMDAKAFNSMRPTDGR